MYAIHFVRAFVVAALATAARTQECYECPHRSYSFGWENYGAAVGDITGDGIADVVVASNQIGGLSILRGQGGTFTPGGTIPGGTTWEVALGDLDLDGDLDLISLSQQENFVRVRLNQGGGSFGAPTTHAVGSAPLALALGDIDGDGDLDVATANWIGNNVSVLRNDGTGSFAPHQAHAVGFAPKALAFGDLDGDGDDDLVVACWAAGTIAVLVNPGNGAFAPSVSIPTVANPGGIVLTDLDGDADLDVAVTGYTANAVGFMRNLGGVTFAAPVLFTVAPTPEALASADFDGDGDRDLIAGSRNPGAVTILSNSGSGSFTTSATIVMQSVVEVYADDLDGDQDPDFVIVDVNNVTVLENAGGSVPGLPRYPTGIDPRQLIVADVNGDANDDMAVVSAMDNRVTILLGQGDTTFVPGASLTTGLAPVAIAADDLDNDGDVDLVVANSGDATVSVFINSGAGSFAPGIVYAGAASALLVVVLADVDQDGDRDLIVGGVNPQATYVSLNSGTGSFGTFTVYPGSGRTIAPADFDGDGDVDLATTGSTQGQHSIGLLRNQGGAAFTLEPGPFLGLLTGAVAAGDVDVDGDVDLVAWGSVTVTYLNDGTGQFTATSSVEIYPAFSVTLEDVDADGDPDLLAASWTRLIVWLNDGSGAFVARTELIVDGRVVFAAARDLDGDGERDLMGILADRNVAFVIRDCDVSGRPYCFGDGSGTNCPCGNLSPVGDRSGCSNSLGAGGKLAALGSATVTHDALVLVGTQMANGACSYFQTAQIGGAGVVFGDGLRCGNGTIVRLGLRTNVNGGSRYPGPGDAPISVRGALPAVGGTRSYQIQYRNSAAFCTPSTFNLTNGLSVLWMP